MNNKLLIVDDEDQILQALQTFFSLRGYDVVTCTDANMAIERVRMEKFHVALLDINMPGVNGIELLHLIRIARPTMQVVMMTAYTTIEKAISCIEEGACDYLLKPFQDLEELANVVQLAADRVHRWEVVARESLRNPKDVTAHHL
jgi:DNA-binding NtrC family response regulator